MGQGYSAVSAEVSLSASATKTLIYIRPPTKVDMKITGWAIGFGASAAGVAVVVEVCRITTLGTPTATTLTPVKRNPYGPASDTAGARGNVTASEPTADVFERYEVAPNGGGIIKQYPLGREPIFKSNDANDAFLIRVVTPTGVTPVASATVEWEEGA